MMGRRDPQRSLFDAQALPHRVPADSFYGRMGAVSDDLFRDDDLEEMYCPDNGRPSVPPSLMSGMTLLQFHDDVSDGEAVARTMFDLRWKVALGLPLDYEGIHSSSLSNFRPLCGSRPGSRIHPGQGNTAGGYHLGQGGRCGTKHLYPDPQGHTQAAQGDGLCHAEQAAGVIATGPVVDRHLCGAEPKSRDRLVRS
jgi:hypothetical protein